MGIDLDRNFLVRYQYILEGHSKDWSPVTDKAEATFDNINEGTYSFKLKAQGPDGIWSSPLTYTFKVLPPWYRHWLAYLSYTLLLITVVWSLYRYGLRKALKRQELKHDISLKMAELEMKALRSQMNPHFIFNSLQSIQNFLIINNSEDANEYLLKFSKLMRLVLENSMQQEVTLRDDILALDLYMQLEQLRFTRPFSYEIIVEDSVNPEVDSIPHYCFNLC
ncbi:MAG: histidine kinase [Bacteroidetes bacterium]|nr:histidine kinase [Bacteroidota bacterium]